MKQHRPASSMFRAVARTLTLALLVVSLILPWRSAAAADYVSVVTGATISYPSDYEASPPTDTSSGVEILILTSSQDVLMVGFVPPALNLTQARDVVLESLGESATLETIDRGEYGVVSYSLDATTIEGTRFGVFTLFLGDRAHGSSEMAVLLAPDSLFADRMAYIQETVTIDGVPVFDGIDADEMGRLLGGKGTSSSGNSQTNTNGRQTNSRKKTPTPDTGQGRSEKTDTTSGDTDEYVTTVTEHVNQLVASGPAFVIGIKDSNSDAVNNALALWDACPATAQGVSVPEGMEDIQADYEDLCGEFASLSAEFKDLMANSQSMSKSEFSTAFDEFAQHLTDAMNMTSPLLGKLEKAGGSSNQGSSNTTRKKTPTPTRQSGRERKKTPTAEAKDGDAEEYIAEVTSHLEDLSASIDSFQNDVADQNTDGLTDALTLWVGCTETAQSLDVPSGMEDVQEQYEQICDDYSGLAEEFSTLADDSKSMSKSELKVAIDEFYDNMASVQADTDNLISDLEDMGTRGSSAKSTKEPTVEATKSSGTSGAGERGLVNDTTWQSPQFGHEVTWDKPFVVDAEDNDSISVDEKTGVDAIELTSSNPRLTYSLAILGKNGRSPRNFATQFKDPEFVDSIFGENTNVLFTDSNERGAAAILEPGKANGILVIAEFTCLDDTCTSVAFSVMTVEPENAAEAYELAMDAILINGDPALTVLDPEVVADNVGN